VILAVSLLSLSSASGAVPAVVNFQGRLLASDGTPEVGILSVGFAMYDVDTGGAPLWSETQTVAFADGFYSVMLGSVAPLPASILSGPSWLSVTVAGTELLPRMPVASVPFALRAEVAEALVTSATGSGSGLDADSVDGLDAADLAAASHSHAPGDADTLDGLDSTAFSLSGHGHAPGASTTVGGYSATGGTDSSSDLLAYIDRRVCEEKAGVWTDGVGCAPFMAATTNAVVEVDTWAECSAEFGADYAPCNPFQALGLSMLYEIPQMTFYWLHAGGQDSQATTDALWRGCCSSVTIAPQINCPAGETIGFFHSWNTAHVDSMSCLANATPYRVLCCRRTFY
jgi:hypothetical protein